MVEKKGFTIGSFTTLCANITDYRGFFLYMLTSHNVYTHQKRFYLYHHRFSVYFCDGVAGMIADDGGGDTELS